MEEVKKYTNVACVLGENYQTCLSRPTHPTHARARMSLLVSLSPDARDGWMDAEWEEEEEASLSSSLRGEMMRP